VPWPTPKLPWPTPKRPITVAVALVGAWLLPLATHAIGIDWLLPLVILVALAALLSGSVLDRSVKALGLLAGLTTAAGVLISLWPWRMSPVAVAGVALSVLALLSAKVKVAKPYESPKDRLVVLGWVVGTAFVALPLVTRGLGARLALIAPGEDFSRHFLIYDAIGQIGGYISLHNAEAQRFVSAASGIGILDYPQGAHFVYALLGHFAGFNEGSVPRPAASLSFLIWCLLGTYSFLILAVLWAARRIAGPGASPLGLFVTLVPIAALLVFGDPVTVLFRGFPNEVLGLALAAVLVGIVARPARRHGEQMVAVVALVVGISFVYYLFLPFAVVVAVVWLVANRRAVLRRWWLLAIPVCAAPLAFITPFANPAANSSYQLLTNGTALTVDRPLTALLLVVTGWALWRRRRSPVDRLAGTVLGVALLGVLVIAVYQYVEVGRTVYYFEKTVHLLIIVSLCAFGTVARLVPELAVRRLREPRLAAVTVLVLLVSVSIPVLGGPWHTKKGSFGFVMIIGVDKGTAGGDDAVYLARHYPSGDDAVVVDLMHSSYTNFSGTLYGSALRRDYRYGEAWAQFLGATNADPKSMADLEALIQATPKSIRFVVGDPSAHTVRGLTRMSNVDIARAMADKYPGKVLVDTGDF
jgi:hypothetical protein